MKKHEDAIEEARAFALQKGPYFAKTIYALTPYPIKGFGTIGVTEGFALIYDPDLVVTWTVAQLAGGMVHESIHVVSDHVGRGAAYDDKETWNRAGDLSFNPGMLESGWELPYYDVPEFHKFPNGLTADQYYDLLKKEQADEAKGGKGKNKKGGSGGGGSQNPSQDPQAQQNNKNEPKFAAGRCGGGGGHHIDKELEARIDAEIGRSEVDAKRIQMETQEDIKQHFEKARGNAPSFLKELINREQKASRIRWQQRFGRLLRKASGMVESGGHDFTLARPSKRSLLRGIVRPSLVQQKPNILFILDTSGSMSRGDLVEVLSEAAHIIRQIGVDEAYMFQVDAAVHNEIPMRVNASKLKEVQIMGRGGTDFRPGFDAAKKMRPRPDIIVYLTDGDGYAPDHPPSYAAVIWCITSSSGDRYKKKGPAPWGEVVLIEK